MIVVAHNYVHVLEICDRVNLLQHGRITLDKRLGGDVGRGADRARLPSRVPRCANERARTQTLGADACAPVG